MKSIKFPQSNLELAKNQPEYQSLHVFVEAKDIESKDQETGNIIIRKNVPWTMTACLELSDEEIAEIVATKRIWHTQCVFGNQFQPIRMSTQNPFEHETK